MPLRTKNAAVLAVIESQEGVFQAPSASTDAILVEAPDVDLQPQNVETNEVTGSLDGRGPIPGGIQVPFNFTVYLKGPGTPGVEPEWADLMRACAWGVDVTNTSITATTIAFSAAGDHITDSGSGFGPLTVGTAIHVSGAPDAQNNGEFIVTVSAAGDIQVTKPDGSAAGFVTVAAGPSITIRRGIAAVAATAGTTTSFTAQSPWVGTLQIYRGMPVLLSGNPATPAFAFISDYTAVRLATLADLFGSALSAATKASIPANVRFTPASASIPSLSMEYYMDGVRYRLKGVRGRVSFQFDAAGACKASFAMRGLFESKTDAAVPATVYDGTRPPTFRNSRFLIQRIQAALRTLSIDAAAEPVYPSNPNASEGFDAPLHVSRNLTGRMDPYARLVATQDLTGAFRAGTEHIIHARVLGGVAAPGNRIGLVVPSAFYTGNKPGDANGLAVDDMPFFCRGQDSGAFLSVY